MKKKSTPCSLKIACIINFGSHAKWELSDVFNAPLKGANWLKITRQVVFVQGKFCLWQDTIKNAGSRRQNQVAK